MDELRDSTQKNLATSNARLDSMATQIQALSESLEEAKSRIGKLGEQLTQTQNIIQTLNAPPQPAAATPGGSSPTPGGEVKPQASIPDPDSLYKSGVSYYNGGEFDLAVQSFQDYLQHYGSTDRAPIAQFYIGDSYYLEKNYKKAIAEYDKCIERYPQGDKAATAQLRKGYALLELGEKSAGNKELRSLIEQYPRSPEADLARQRLKSSATTARRH